MLRKYFLYGLAALLLIFALMHALYEQRRIPETPPPVPPTTSPFGHTVAGLGMVEASSEASGTGNIAIGSQVSGIVTSIRVRIGQTVKKGELLFELDKRQAEADLQVRQAALVVAEEQLRKLQMQPRPEEVPPSAAQVAAAQAQVKQLKDQYERGKLLLPTKAIEPEEFVMREQAYRAGHAQLEVAKANLALLKAGAWKPDKAIAAANVAQARAQVALARTNLDLLQVKAPVAGDILQINVRPGEFVSTFGGQSLITMGSVHPLHVRVNVDEEDLPRLKLYAPAIAKIRGDEKQEELPLTYVRLEPFVVPKMSLTGINVERVDTRVAQVIYAVDGNHRLVQDHKVLVGQLLDVFINTQPRAAGPQR